MRMSSLLMVLSLGLVASGPALAGDPDTWPVKGRLDGKYDKDDHKYDKAKDVSGIACIEDKGFPRHCLLIDDDVNRAQIVVVEDGKLIAGDCLKPDSGSTPATEMFGEGCLRLIPGDVSLDGEGVSFVPDGSGGGTFYVIGSHGVSRKGSVTDAEALAASSHLLAIAVKAGQIDDEGNAKPVLSDDPTKLPDLDLRAALLALPELNDTRDHPLDENGLTIEGVAIADSTIYAGLRAPVFDGPQGARILAAPLADRSHGKLIPLDLGQGRGVRDLAAYGNGDQAGILILAGPSKDPDPGKPIGPKDYSLYFWQPPLGIPRPLGDIQGFGHTTDSDAFKAEKPEAILPLDVKNGRLQVLVLFDGGKEGTPRAIEFAAP